MQEDVLIPPIEIDVAYCTLIERLPELDIHTIKYLGGGSFSCFAVNNEYVFRFPKDPNAFQEVQAHGIREAALLNAIKHRMEPHEVSRQTHALLDSSQSFHGPVFGYTFFEGVQVAQKHMHPSELPRVARLLGDFLSKLHAIELAAVYPFGYEPTNAETIRQGWYQNYLANKEIVFPLLTNEEKRWMGHLYERFLDISDKVNPMIVLTHGDFGWENVLVPQSLDKLQVIDFEDVAVGSAIGDFCLWLGYFGKEFICQMLQDYYTNADEYFAEVVQFYYGRIPCFYFSWGAQSQNQAAIAFGRHLLHTTMEQSKQW